MPQFFIDDTYRRFSGVDSSRVEEPDFLGGM
jgi:hypothetical protein